MSEQAGHRRSGLLVPLFSSPSTASWGIGDIGDVSPLTAWLCGAGQRVLQLLPLNEMAPGQQSPYSAISAMAIDPIYVHVPAVPEWIGLGGHECLSREDRDLLAHVRATPRVEHAAVRRLKAGALSASFDRFYDHEWRRQSDRARALSAFVSAQAWWVEDYALFCALRAHHLNRPWMEWPDPFRLRDPEALTRARSELGRDLVRYQYLQWIAHEQWQAARAIARANGVQLFGDLPFMVDADSADVWSHQRFFRLDVSIGAPPDAFSDDGQDWGMPLYDWTAVARANFPWLRARARRNKDLYDGYRVDHLVGFYRTYGRPSAGGAPFFTPALESEQVALGESVLSILLESGAEIIAEDLGIVPDFVRSSMMGQGVPGFCVLRWERRWTENGQPFRDPGDYPASSVAASGTHDTEPLIVWWGDAPPADRELVNELPTVQRVTNGVGLRDPSFNPAVRDGLLESLFASGSNLLLLPVQDVFGWPDRINQPGTVTPENWTFRLPWPCDALKDVPEARERQTQLCAWAAQYQRL